MKKRRMLVVGAGFAGATAARILAEKGYFVDVLESSNYIGGCAADDCYSDGLIQGKFGAHIFHTSMENVWNFVTRFGDFIIKPKHKVYSYCQDLGYLNFPPTSQLIKMMGKKNAIDLFYKGYSEKMWGIPFNKLPNSVKNRKKMGNVYSTDYFPNSLYEGVPKEGYTNLIGRMLTHPNIAVFLSTPFKKEYQKSYVFTFTSSSPDQYFDFEEGHFEYRTLEFRTRKHEDTFLNAAVINFPDPNVTFIRQVNWNNFQNNINSSYSKMITTYEYPAEYDFMGNSELKPLYPKPWKRKDLHRYKKLIESVSDNTAFIGRLGNYAYLDMDQTIAGVMRSIKKNIKN